MGSKSPRIIHPVNESRFKFEVQKERRSLINKASGYTVSESAWRTIEILTRRYLIDSANETRGVETKVLQKHLRVALLAAANLRSKIPTEDSNPLFDALHTDIELLYRKYFVENNLNVFKQGAVYSLLALATDAMIAVATFTAKEMKDEAEVASPVGESWEIWISFLHGILTQQGFSCTIRKDSDKSTKVSPFVIFVRELQQSIPKEARRYTHSSRALSQAMNRARMKRV